MSRCDPLATGQRRPAGLAAAARAVLPILAAVAASSAAAPPGATAAEQAAWTTYNRDAGRSGDDTEVGEQLTPTRAWQAPLEGASWGQPLVLGERVYVATAANDLYALNAATGAVIWKKEAGAPVASEHLPCPGDVSPTVGIVGTPVIDQSAGAIYAVADIWNEGAKKAEHVLESYGLAHGEPLHSTPVDPPGVDAAALLQRTALTLDDGQVVFGMGGNDGDCGEYKGVLVAAPETGGGARFWQYHPAAPAYGGGAIWGPSGPVVDGEDIYLATGNPNFPEGSEVSSFDMSDAFLRFDLSDLVTDPTTTEPEPLGWFEPPAPQWRENSNSDRDLGSAGPELLPGGLLFQAGKGSKGYLLEAGIGKGGSAVYEAPVCYGAKSFGGDAYAEGVIYVGCENGVQALAYTQAGANSSFTPLWPGPADAFGPPIVAGGSVWTVATGGFGGGGTKLYALEPANGKPRYTETLPSPVANHFASPSAAGGRLFVADGASVVAYRIAEPPAEEEEEEEGEKGTSQGGGSGGAGNTSPAASDGASDAPTTSGPGAGGASTAQPAAAWLLRSRLRAGRRGRIRLRLYCASPASACRGTITLRAEIPIAERGEHERERTVYLTLAHERFGPARGAFAAVAEIGRAGLAHLRLHRGRLALRVRIACDGGRILETAATLT